MSVEDYFLIDCPTYKDYLNVFVTKDDIRLLRNMRAAHRLVQLNYRSTTTIYSRELFEIRKQKVHDALHPVIHSVTGFSHGLDPKDPVLREIALRERPNLLKMLSTIICIHSIKEGSDESSFMDLEDSIRSSAELDDGAFWRAVFEERARLTPDEKHLSYFHLRKGIVVHNDSPNYRVLHDAQHGLTFMHKGDHKKICVNADYYQTHSESTILSPVYGFVKFYDHAVRKKI